MVYSLAIMFPYMVAELSALQQVINLLAGTDGLPVIIAEVTVTTIYTCKSLKISTLFLSMYFLIRFYDIKLSGGLGSPSPQITFREL